MPSTSKAQQRLMGVAYAVKNGDMQLSDVDAAYRKEVEELVDNMTLKHNLCMPMWLNGFVFIKD